MNAATPSPVPVLQLMGISKTFPGVRALDQVDFDLYPGEIHALLGENGAGKSTLMKVLSGTLPKDGGSIRLDGVAVNIRDPLHARTLGIGMVYQELSLVPTLTVAENLFLGRWERARGIIDWARMQARALEALERVGLEGVSPLWPVRRLGMAEQQLVEIARVLLSNARILLLDEPTSALSGKEVARLFEILRRLKTSGVAIIYVSHRLAEVQQIADRITVLRDGRRVGTVAAHETTEAHLIQMMVGRELRHQYPKAEVPVGQPLLRVRGLSTQQLLRDISFDLRVGEILGVFGLMGAGRTELARALFGLDPLCAGEISVDGRRLAIRSPGDAIAAGIGYLTEDRRQGLVLTLPIPPNVTLASLPAVFRSGVLSPRSEEQLAAAMVDRLRIVTPHLRQRVANLSGGNQQKVALARWLVSRARVLLFDEPTRGIDVGAKAEVFTLMGQLAREGAGILMFSSELPEVLAVADRVLVMARGRITGVFARGEATPEAVMLKAAGAEVRP